MYRKNDYCHLGSAVGMYTTMTTYVWIWVHVYENEVKYLVGKSVTLSDRHAMKLRVQWSRIHPIGTKGSNLLLVFNNGFRCKRFSCYFNDSGDGTMIRWQRPPPSSANTLPESELIKILSKSPSAVNNQSVIISTSDRHWSGVGVMLSHRDQH